MPKKDIIIKDGLIVNAGTTDKKLHVDPSTGNVSISGSLSVSGDVTVEGSIASGSTTEIGISSPNSNLAISPGSITGSGNFTFTVSTPATSSNDATIATTAFVKSVALTNVAGTGAASGEILIGGGTNYSSSAVTGDISLTNAGVTALTTTSFTGKSTITSAATGDYVLVADVDDSNNIKKITVNNLVGTSTFTNVGVAGQVGLSASTNPVLTIAAGTGVSLSAAAESSTLTITAQGSGSVEDGTTSMMAFYPSNSATVGSASVIFHEPTGNAFTVSGSAVAGTFRVPGGGSDDVYVPDEVIWNSDQDLMIRKRTSNQLEFRAGGTDYLVVGNSHVWVENGNLGVGFSPDDNPSHKLHVSASSDVLKLEGLATGSSTTALVIDGDGVIKKGTIALGSVGSSSIAVGALYTVPYYSADPTGSNFDGASDVYIKSNRLGINVADPQNLLHVSASSDPARIEGMVTDETLNTLVVADSSGILHKTSVLPQISSSGGVTGSRFYAGDGTYALPAYSFSSQGTLGFLKIASNIVGFEANGNRFFFDANTIRGLADQPVIKFAASAEGTPNIYWYGDSDTGFYKPGADEIGITAGGVNRLNISSSITSSVPTMISASSDPLQISGLAEGVTSTALVLGSDGVTIYKRANAIGGTVSAVSASATNGIVVSGSPVTGSGNLAFSLNASEVATHISSSITISASQVTTGATWDISLIPTGSITISASQVTAGELAIARIPTGSITISASQVTAGELADGRISSGSITQHSGAIISVISTTMFSGAALTGVPTAPTPSTSSNDTTIATTAYVQSASAEAAGMKYVRFKIAASNGSVGSNNDVVADKATDDVTFFADTGIELTTDSTNDRIYFKNTQAGGTVTSVQFTGSNGIGISDAVGSLPVTGAHGLTFTLGDITPTTAKLTSTGSAASPSLGVTGSGANNYGFYTLPSAGQLGISVDGAGQVLVSNTVMMSKRSGQWGLLHEDPSDTNPNVVPNANDPDTGIGAQAADNLSLIAGGTEAMRLTATAVSSSLEISASSFVGDGSGLTGIISSGDALAVTSVSASSFISASAFYGDGSALSGVAADISSTVLGSRKNSNTKLYVSQKLSGSTAQASSASVGNYAITLSGANTGSADRHFEDTQPYDFTTVYNYVQIGGSTNWGTELGTDGDFTFEFFVESDADGPKDIFVWPGCKIQITNPSVGGHDNGITITGLGSSWWNINCFPKNEWLHMAIVRSSGTAKLYINGTYIDDQSSSAVWPSGSGYFTFGAERGGNASFDGRVDEVHFTHEALYTAAFTPPTRRADDIQNTFFLEDLANVPITGLVSGSYLTYDGVNWVATSGSAGGGGGGSGTITALNNQSANRLTTIGASTTELDGEANLTFDGSTLAVTGVVSASSNISGSSFYGDGSNLTGISGTGTVTNIGLTGSNGVTITSTNTLPISGSDQVTITLGALTPTSVSASLGITASAFHGDGSNLTGISGTGTVTNIGLTGSSGITITSTNTLPISGSDQVTFTLGALTPTSVSASANISASSFFGDGSNLSGISASGNLTNKGDIEVYTSSQTRLGSGSNGQVLTVDTSAASGLAWAAAAGAAGSYTHTSSASPPGSPSTGDWWYDNTNNILYNRVTDSAATVAWVDVSTATSTLVIKDADSDTKIQVEESADEDKIRFDTAGTERMVIDQTGSIGIGVTLPSYPIHHSSGAKLTTGGVWTDNSVRAHKQNIRNLTFDEAMDAFNQLEPVHFEYKRGAEPHCGFIADDVPDLVASNDRTGLSSMDIVSVLTKVVQKQQTQINELMELLKNKE